MNSAELKTLFIREYQPELNQYLGSNSLSYQWDAYCRQCSTLAFCFCWNCTAALLCVKSPSNITWPCTALRASVSHHFLFPPMRQHVRTDESQTQTELSSTQHQTAAQTDQYRKHSCGQTDNPVLSLQNTTNTFTMGVWPWRTIYSIKERARRLIPF